MTAESDIRPLIPGPRAGENLAEALGVGEFSWTVYLAAMAEPTPDVAAIAVRLGVEQPKVRAALHELCQVPLVSASGRDPVRFTLLDPTVALSPIIADLDIHLRSKQAELVRASAAITELEARWTWRRGGTVAARAVGTVASRSLARVLVADTRSSLLVAAANPTQAYEPLDRAMVESCMARSVTVHGLFAAGLEPPHGDCLRDLELAGARVRTTSSPPQAPVIVSDRRTALVATIEDGDVSCVVVRSAEVVTALTTLLDALWEHAEPFARPAISAQDRQLMRLLRSGITDECVSRKLGISVRTVRRNVANLLQRLNARSRFEAGYKAGTGGLL